MYVFMCVSMFTTPQVIKNGQLLGVQELTSRNQVSSLGSMAKSGMEVIGDVPLVNFYNDGGKGTGNKEVRGCARPRIAA